MTGTSQPSATADTGYRPTITEAYAKQIHRWHGNAYQSLRTAAESVQRFDYLGLTLDVPLGVMPITAISDLLGKAVLTEVRTGDRVLDMGTGCGVNASSRRLRDRFSLSSACRLWTSPLLGTSLVYARTGDR
jgi:release factor glutamine methyltransferase